MDNQILLEENNKRHATISLQVQLSEAQELFIGGLEDRTATLPAPVRGGKDEDAAQRLQRP